MAIVIALCAVCFVCLAAILVSPLYLPFIPADVTLGQLAAQLRERLARRARLAVHR